MQQFAIVLLDTTNQWHAVYCVIRPQIYIPAFPGDTSFPIEFTDRYGNRVVINDDAKFGS